MLPDLDNYCFWAILRAKNNKESCQTETEQIYIILDSYLGLVSNPTTVKESIPIPICSFVMKKKLSQSRKYAIEKTLRDEIKMKLAKNVSPEKVFGEDEVK